MAEAALGTVRDGRLVHPMNPERSGVDLKTIRGDYKDEAGNTRNRLRRWEVNDFMPRPEDIYQERLYAIQWITKASAFLNRAARREQPFWPCALDLRRAPAWDTCPGGYRQLCQPA